MKWALLVGWLASTCSGCSISHKYTVVSSVPTHLIVDSTLAHNLGTLTDALDRELVFCLVGQVRGHRAYATNILWPRHRLSTPTRAALEYPCPFGTVAVWHNHSMPIDWPPLAVFGCSLSGIDISQVARGRVPFAVVSTDSRHMCWWTRQQAVAAYRRGQQILSSLPNQRTF